MSDLRLMFRHGVTSGVAALFATIISGSLAPASAQQQPPDMIYWAEQGSEHPGYSDPTPTRFVWRTPIGSTVPAAVAGFADREPVVGLTVNSTSGKIYTVTYTLTSGQTTLYEHNLDGSSPRTVLSCAYPCQWQPRGGFRTDPASGKLVIVAPRAIYTIDPAEVAPAAIAAYSFPDNFESIGGDFDAANGDVVFIEHFSQHFWAVKLDGSDFRMLGAVCPQHRCSRAVAVDGATGRIYYGKYGDGDLYRVFSQSFDGSGNVEMYGPFAGASQHSINDMVIDFSSRTLYISHGREGFGQGIDRAALYGDAAFWNQGAYNAALSQTPTYLALDGGSAGGGGGGPSDTTPPVISDVPADITVAATSVAGASVTYTAPTANDDVSGSVAVDCAPASGSTFAVGTATVACSAADAAGNSASATFSVTVSPYVPPPPTIAQLLADLVAMVNNVGPGNSLTAKSRAAQQAYASGNSGSAAASLQALLNEVKAQTGKKIGTAQAAQITALTNQIITRLGA